MGPKYLLNAHPSLVSFKGNALILYYYYYVPQFALITNSVLKVFRSHRMEDEAVREKKVAAFSVVFI